MLTAPLQRPTLSQTMQLSFIPHVGDTIHAPQAACILFTVVLSSADHNYLNHNRIKIQLWSDIPSTDHYDGEWYALDFEDFRLASSSTTTDDAFLDLTDGLDISDDSPMLSLQVGLRPPCTPSRSFSFTYRLAHPNGEVEWLGPYGRDGTLILDDDPNLHTDLVATPGAAWLPTKRGLLWQGKSSQGRGFVEVAKLCDPSQYNVWAFSDETFLDAARPSLVVLVPRSRPRSVILRQVLFLGASPEASISVSSTGVISVTSSESICLLRINAHNIADLQSFVSQYSPAACHIVASGVQPNCILITSTGGYPRKALVLPITPDRRPYQHVQLKHADLVSGLPMSVTQFALCSADFDRVRFFAHPVEHMDIKLVVDDTGSTFRFCPLFSMDKSQCHVAVLSDHASPVHVADTSEGRNGLHTLPLRSFVAQHATHSNGERRTATVIHRLLRRSIWLALKVFFFPFVLWFSVVPHMLLRGTRLLYRCRKAVSRTSPNNAINGHHNGSLPATFDKGAEEEQDPRDGKKVNPEPDDHETSYVTFKVQGGQVAVGIQSHAAVSWEAWLVLEFAGVRVKPVMRLLSDDSGVLRFDTDGAGIVKVLCRA